MKKKITKLIDCETSHLLKDVGYTEPCYFYYTSSKTLMLSDVKTNYNDHLTDSSVIFTKDAIEWIKTKLSESDLEVVKNRYGVSKKETGEARDLEDLNNLIDFYKRKYINNGNRI